MPNGGSDCCGTCWFNARNKGDAGDAHAHEPEANFCTIRGLAIDNPFWTYCGNHPHKRPHKDPIPIGPVFVLDEASAVPFYYPRKVWQSSPDTEDIRCHLLELLGGIREQPREEYPAGMHSDDVVVWQLGEFREERAWPDLRRILRFSPDVTPRDQIRTRLLDAAREALAKIEAGPGVVHRNEAREVPRPWLAVKADLQTHADIQQSLDELDQGGIADRAAQRLREFLGRAPALLPAVVMGIIGKLRRVGPLEGTVSRLLLDLGAPALKALTRGLSQPSNDLRLRSQMAFAIGSFGTAAEEALPSLKGLLKEDMIVRVHAAMAILQITGQALRKDKLTLIVLEGFQGDQALACKAADCLRAIGPAAGAVVPSLIALLGGQQEAWRRALAATALGGMGPEAAQAIPTLIMAAGDEDEDVSGSAYGALRELRALARVGELILVEFEGVLS